MDQNSSQAKIRGGSYPNTQAKPHRGNPRQHTGQPASGGQGVAPTMYWGNGHTASSDRGGRGGRRGCRTGHSPRGQGRGLTQEMMELNFENIRRMDACITNILDHSSQVAIFTRSNDQWNEAVAVGSLLMYQRAAHHGLGIVIMNRQSVKNWIHTVTERFELVVQQPYWLVKDGDSIFCIWFYDSTDIIRLAKIFLRFQHSVVIDEGGNKMDSGLGLKPPNLLATQQTGETLGDAILAMLTKPKTELTDETAGRTVGTNLLNLIVKPDPTKNEDSVAHPLPIKPEPISPQQAFKQSPKSKVQLRTPGASSFAEVAARPKEMEQKSASVTEQKIEKPRVRKGDETGTASFTMQTVEQLEKENQKEKQEGPNLGGHGFLTHEHLAQQPSPQPQPEKSHQKMTNELRAKLGLPPCFYSVSPDDEDAVAPYYPNVIDHAIGSFSTFSLDGSLYAESDLPKVDVGKKSDKQKHAGVNRARVSAQQLSPAKDNAHKNLRYQTIDDIHGRELSEVEPHELEYILNAHAEQAKNLRLMPQPGGGSDDSRLVWTNTARGQAHELAPRLAAPAYSAQAASGILNLGVPTQDLPLTANQLVKTFKILLHDQEFVAKFHNAYLQVRSEEDL